MGAAMQPFAGLPAPTGFARSLWERASPRRAAQRPLSPSQGSSPIPRKITLVTVCTALSNAMSDSISPPLSNCTW